MKAFIVCDFCDHLIKRRKTCKAFPDGIPDEILSGTNEHHKPLKGQKNNLTLLIVIDKGHDKPIYK